MKPYYELHVTYLGHEAQMDGWKPSVIHGDPVLGDGPRRYLTRHAPEYGTSLDQLIADMERVADDLAAAGRKVLRTKVELVMYDRRTP